MTYRIKTINEFPNYKIDTNGDVWTCVRRKGLGKGNGTVWSISDAPIKMKPVNIKGYMYIGLRANGKSVLKRINRLVLETFRGECPWGMQGCHNNGIKHDNKLENLRWDTAANNHHDRISHGTISVNAGIKNPNAKLNTFQVARIRLMKEITPSLSAYKIAKLLGVSRGCIYGVLHSNWKTP